MDSIRDSQPIVIVDDDPDVGVLMRHILREAHVPNPLRIILDPTEALQTLQGMCAGAPEERPLLVLVDLKMPRLNGFDLLAWMRDHPDCLHLPRIVLSSSLDDRDVTRATQLGATGFLTKYPAPATFAAIVRFAAQCHDAEDLLSLPEMQRG